MSINFIEKETEVTAAVMGENADRNLISTRGVFHVFLSVEDKRSEEFLAFL